MELRSKLPANRIAAKLLELHTSLKLLQPTVYASIQTSLWHVTEDTVDSLSTLDLLLLTLVIVIASVYYCVTVTPHTTCHSHSVLFTFVNSAAETYSS